MIGRFTDELTKNCLFSVYEVAVSIEVIFCAGQNVTMARTDQFRTDSSHDLCTPAVHMKLKAVSKNGRLKRTQCNASSLEDFLYKVVVSCKGHFFAIHHDRRDRVELCLSRSEEDLQLILLPLKLFPVFEATVDSDWLRENTGCTRSGRRVLEDLRDFLQRPAGCSMVALQIGDAASMVVMNVGGQN